MNPPSDYVAKCQLMSDTHIYIYNMIYIMILILILDSDSGF